MDGATTTLVINGLFSLGAGTTAVAVVNGLLSRQKTKAEAERTRAETGKTDAEIMGVTSTAQATQVETAMVLVREMRLNQDRLEAKINRLETWKLSHERRMDAHIRWDEQIRVVLQQNNIMVDAPPDLREITIIDTGDQRG